MNKTTKAEPAVRAARAVTEAFCAAGRQRLDLTLCDTLADSIETILSAGPDDLPMRHATGEIISRIAPIIAAQYAEVMDVLRDALREGFAYGRGVVECVECKSRARKEKQIIHVGACWVSRAQKIVGEA